MKLIKEHKYWRILEVVPGVLSWSALILPIVLSIYYPTIVAGLLIAYTVFWLFRSWKLSFNILRAHRIIKKARQTNWNKLLNFFGNPLQISSGLKFFSKKKSDCLTHGYLQTMRANIESLKNSSKYIHPSEIYHAIIFVTYKESLAILRESIKSYAQSSFDTKKIIFVFGAEERDKENATKCYEILKKEFGHKFYSFILSMHPANIAGEIKGKSANATWTAKTLQKQLDKDLIPYENVILSNFDADTVAEKDYFSELTFKYLMTPDRTKKTFQPTHMFHNNIWDVPTMVRMVSLSCTFYRMAESMDREKYKSFSSRSMSFQTAVDTDFWDPSVIPEDSRQFWTAFIRSDGDHELISVCTPVYMDAVLDENYIKTFKSQYEQLRRWAWGVCDFPFVAINLIANKKIPWPTKIKNIFEFLENAFFWATGPLIITFTGWIPGLINDSFNTSVIAYNLPHVTSFILTISGVGIVMCAIISLVIVPHRKDGRQKFGYTLLILQWLLIPVVSIFLNAIPALDAQTRLMFGRRLEYKVTVKARK